MNPPQQRRHSRTICPFCGLLLALTCEPAGIVHGMPLCQAFREAPDPATFLERAAAQVEMQKRGGARAKA